MNNNIVKIFAIIAFIITSILGVLLHFAYDFSGHNIIIGLFTPVNESTWEHLKLLFFPALICMIMGLFIIKPQVNRIPLYQYNYRAALNNCAILYINRHYRH